jgi:hypothetical protein
MEKYALNCYGFRNYIWSKKFAKQVKKTTAWTHEKRRRFSPKNVCLDNIDSNPLNFPCVNPCLDVVPKPVEVFVVEIGAERRPVGSDVD